MIASRYSNVPTVGAAPPSVLSRTIGRRETRRRYLLIVLTAVLGIAGTLGITGIVRSYEQRVDVLKFESIARDRLSIIGSDFNLADIVLRTLRSLLESVDHPVTREEFISFSRSLHSFADGLRDTVWAPRVTLAERPAFERSMQESGFANFEIREPGPDGKLIRAGDRDVYFPILYAEGDPRANKIIGVNIGFGKIRQDVLRRAQETGAPAATPPLHLLTIPPEHFGLLSVLTVTGRSSAPGSPPSGIVLTAFDAVEMIEAIVKKKASLPGLDVFVFGPAAEPDAKPVFARDITHDEPPPNLGTLLQAPHLTGSLMVADQPWLVVFRPSQEAGSNFWTWPTMIPLVGGLTFTLMIVAYLLLSARRTAQLEKLTSDLRSTGEELGKNMAQVRYLAHHDQLTGLPNRIVFYECLKSALSKGRPFFLLYLDLDRFKPVNDTLGHAAGDQILREVATRLHACLRDDDVLARLGGDEFAVIARTSEEAACAFRLAERLIAVVKDPYVVEGTTVEIGLSVGIASSPTDGDTVECLQLHADHALYAAKNAGRGTVCLFNAPSLAMS